MVAAFLRRQFVRSRDSRDLMVFLLPEWDYHRVMNEVQQKLFKTRLVMIAVALIVAAIALGLNKLIR